jgi:hypothetical protein
MLSNGIGSSVREREEWLEGNWFSKDLDERSNRNGKRFIQCICPKCSNRHNIYMLWSGRGKPRKYCANCRPLVSGYDAVAFYEAAICAPGHSKKKGQRYESE